MSEYLLKITNCPSWGSEIHLKLNFNKLKDSDELQNPESKSNIAGIVLNQNKIGVKRLWNTPQEHETRRGGGGMGHPVNSVWCL